MSYPSLPTVPHVGEIVQNISKKDTMEGFCRFCGNESFATLKDGDAVPCKFCQLGQKKIAHWIEGGRRVPSYAPGDLDPDSFATLPWAHAATTEQAADAIEAMRKLFARSAARAGGFRGRDPLGKMGQRTVEEANTVESTAEEVPNDPAPDAPFIGEEPPPPAKPTVEDDGIPF